MGIGSLLTIAHFVAMSPVALRLADGHVLLPLAEDNASPLLVHRRFLRERCASPASVEPASRQPWRSLSHPRRAAAASATITAAEADGDALTVEYSDGHRAQLDLGRLRAEVRCGGKAGALISPSATVGEPRPWSAGDITVHKVEHETLSMHRDWPFLAADAAEARRALLEALLRDGIALVRNAPCRSHEVARFAKDLVGVVRETHWGAVFDVQSSADSADSDGQADQAYGAAEIDFHVDNPYRTPVPEFQLLHCLEWDQEGTEPHEGANRFVDGFACAERLRETDADAFAILARTPLKWENDAPLTSLQPAIQLSADGTTVERVFFSSKSGGFAPFLPVEQLDAFYAAMDKFVALFESDEFVITSRLEPGDIVMFRNTRVLHARNAFSSAVTRHLQGMYTEVDAVEMTLARLGGDQAKARAAKNVPRWTALTESSGEDVREVSRQYSADQAENRVQRVLDMLRAQRGKHSELGGPVDLFQHGLQTATRAHRAGESVDIVVAGLLHDIGELFVPENHGDVAAAILAPYLEPAVTKVLQQHEIFQAQFYGDKVGLRVDHAALQAMPEYELTQRFCKAYDQTSFDPEYDSLPISFFRPMVEQVFSRKPYWHTTGHPKAGLVTGA